MVLREVPDAFLLLMGYPNEEAYRSRARAMGVDRYMIVTGRVPYEEASRYLTLGDIAVAPKRSQTEANGKIYNYMACGLPTVAFDTIVNRDILGDLGVYVHDLNDAQGLARKIVGLLTNDQWRKTLAEQVRRKAVGKYSWDHVAGRLVGAYQAAQESAGFARSATLGISHPQTLP
jgi:glycosyltransferase involved in cell wall biosynthesis